MAESFDAVVLNDDGTVTVTLDKAYVLARPKLKDYKRFFLAMEKANKEVAKIPLEDQEAYIVDKAPFVAVWDDIFKVLPTTPLTAKFEDVAEAWMTYGSVLGVVRNHWLIAPLARLLNGATEATESE